MMDLKLDETTEKRLNTFCNKFLINRDWAINRAIGSYLDQLEKHEEEKTILYYEEDSHEETR